MTIHAYLEGVSAKATGQPRQAPSDDAVSWLEGWDDGRVAEPVKDKKQSAYETKRRAWTDPRFMKLKAEPVQMPPEPPKMAEDVPE